MENTITLDVLATLSSDQIAEVLKAKKAEERAIKAEERKALSAKKAEERKALSAWSLANGQWSYGVVTDETPWCVKFNAETVCFEIIGTIPSGTVLPMASPKHAFKAYKGINSALRKIGNADYATYTYIVK